MNPDLDFQPLPSKAAAKPEAPALSNGETALVYLTVGLLLAVGFLGLLASFQSVSATAARWGFEIPQILPSGIDLAIPGFTIANLLLIRMDMELAWVRAVPWTLTAVTVYLNIQAGSTLPAKIGHGALPLVWVACSEIAGHVYRSKIGAVTGKRMERIRRARWFLAPLSTSRLWRRMVLWEEISYASALGRERDQVLARAGLRERHGRFWRSKAPIRERALLKLGELAPTSERERLSAPQAERPTTTPLTVSAPERLALTSAIPSALTAAEQAKDVSVSAVSAEPERAQPPAPPTVERPVERERPSVEPAQPERPKVSAKPARAPKTDGAQVSALADARSLAVVPLYTTLNRRPEWTEIRDALIEAGHGEVSRPTAQRIRERAEKHHPELTALVESAPTSANAN